MNEPLFLNVGHSIACRLHPVVVLSILDHYVRRNDGQNRTIGTLLGVNNEGVVQITNSFALPQSDTDHIDQIRDFHRNMQDLHIKANPQETVVGWYATGNKIDENSVRIHEFYWREMQAPPVHLLVDTGLHNNKLSISTYIGSPLSLGSPEETLSVGFHFKPIRFDFEAQKPEKTAADVLLKAQNNKGASMNQLDSLELSLKRLLALIEVVSSYLQRVQRGEEVADPKIGSLLQGILDSLPKVDSPVFQKMFNKSMDDLLMVVYLAKMTTTQLKLTDNYIKLL